MSTLKPPRGVSRELSQALLSSQGSSSAKTTTQPLLTSTSASAAGQASGLQSQINAIVSEQATEDFMGGSLSQVNPGVTLHVPSGVVLLISGFGLELIGDINLDGDIDTL